MGLLAVVIFEILHTERSELVHEYELDRFEVVQVHPIYGRRSLINADGHGQLVWEGEVAGSLLILDQWNCMGYKEGLYQPGPGCSGADGL